jgi:hypothetical protein
MSKTGIGEYTLDDSQNNRPILKLFLSLSFFCLLGLKRNKKLNYW